MKHIVIVNGADKSEQVKMKDGKRGIFVEHEEACGMKVRGPTKLDVHGAAKLIRRLEGEQISDHSQRS